MCGCSIRATTSDHLIINALLIYWRGTVTSTKSHTTSKQRWQGRTVLFVYSWRCSLVDLHWPDKLRWSSLVLVKETSRSAWLLPQWRLVRLLISCYISNGLWSSTSVVELQARTDRQMSFWHSLRVISSFPYSILRRKWSCIGIIILFLKLMWHHLCQVQQSLRLLNECSGCIVRDHYWMRLEVFCLGWLSFSCIH